MNTPTLEDRLRSVEAKLNVLIDREMPVVSFAQIHARLGYRSPQSTRKWIADHKLAKVGPAKYRQVDFLNASTGRAA